MRLFPLVLFFLSTLAMADDLVIEDAWARATPPGAKNAAVYLTLTNTGGETRKLVGVETELAAMSSIHETIMSDGMMKMRHIDQVEINPGQTVHLVPGGLHIMLMKLDSPLTEGMRFTLKLEAGNPITTEVKVGSIGQMQAP